MQTPPYLTSGDKIGIVSTASKIDKTIVDRAVTLLKSIGYLVEIGMYAFARSNQFAGTDDQRASDLQNMIDNPEIKAVICSRGGYGTLRTLKNVSWEKFKTSPKWIVGFSDITVLHSLLNQMGICSIHGVMPRYFLDADKPTKSFSTLIDGLTGKPLHYIAEPSKYNRFGKSEGTLVGGNLSILYSLRGTSYDIDTRGKVLFIEDLSEYLYHLDRMMMNLKAGGKLAQLAGLIVGSFTGMQDNDTPYGQSAEEIIRSAVEEYDYPVLFHFPAGHQANNFALKLGAWVHLEITSKGAVINQ